MGYRLGFKFAAVNSYGVVVWGVLIFVSPADRKIARVFCVGFRRVLVRVIALLRSDLGGGEPVAYELGVCFELLVLGAECVPAVGLHVVVYVVRTLFVV